MYQIDRRCSCGVTGGYLLPVDEEIANRMLALLTEEEEACETCGEPITLRMRREDVPVVGPGSPVFVPAAVGREAT